jgi:Predicted membrane protein (DUF2079)
MESEPLDRESASPVEVLESEDAGLIDASHRNRESTSDAYEDSRTALYVAVVLFGLQFMGLLVYSWVQYHRFDLGIDFASVNQAATEISRGDLNPYSTILGSSFLDNHFALFLWPIGALLFVFRSPFILLIIQDLFLAGTGLLTFKWASDLLESRQTRRAAGFAILAVTAVLLLLNPLVYYSAALDFHFEATATFFAVFAAYDVWAGRHRRAWIWVALCLTCGDLGGLCVAGVGISAVLAGKSTRRQGALYVLAGVLWVGLITALNANQGSLLDNYAYLAGRSTLPKGFRGPLLVLGGALSHPARLTDMFREKARMMWRYLPPGGVIGIVTPWGFGVPAIILLSSALQSNTLFIGEPFQQFAVMPFVMIGTVFFLTALMSSDVHLFHRSPAWADLWARYRSGRWAVVGILLFALLLGGIRYAHEYLPDSFTDNATANIITSSQAAALSTALGRTPSGAEVVSSNDISGRFSGRKYAYIYFNDTTPIPLHAGDVELVMDTVNDPYVTPAQKAAAAQFLESKFHAHTVMHRDGVWALTWRESTNRPAVTLP